MDFISVGINKEEVQKKRGGTALNLDVEGGKRLVFCSRCKADKEFGSEGHGRLSTSVVNNKPLNATPNRLTKKRLLWKDSRKSRTLISKSVISPESSNATPGVSELH